MYKYLIFLFLFASFSCKKVDQVELEKNKNLLLENQWGLPQVIFSESNGGSIFLNSPTEFENDGTVLIGTNYEDYWEFIDERTIRFLNAEINWQIISITDTSLHVNMVKMNTSEFVMECQYVAL